MENVVNQPVTTGSIKQSFALNNKIMGIKYLIRSGFYLVLFLAGYGLGIVMGTGQLTSKINKQGLSSNDLTSNPVFSGVTFQGKLKSLDGNSVVLEHDGVELTLNKDKEISVFDLKSTGNSTIIKVEDIQIGTNLRGSAIIKKDEATAKNGLFVNSLIIN